MAEPTAQRPPQVNRLWETLVSTNQRTYLEKMQDLARAFGVAPPDDIGSERVLSGIEQRADVSAQSILQTQIDRAAALVDQYGSGGAAQAAFDDWFRAQSDLIAQYETAMTASRALSDVVQSNDLTGVAHVEPSDTAGLDDTCDDLVDMGDVPLDQVDVSLLPAHPRCPHSFVIDVDPRSIPDSPWLGDSDE